MNIQDKLQEKTVSLLSEELNEINSGYLSEYIKDHINEPLSYSALRIYNAINFNIDEKDKKILALALAYRFAGSLSTIPPFILDALGQERLNGKYQKVGTIKWFLANPEAIKLYYEKYKGTNRLPYTSNTDNTNIDTIQTNKDNYVVQLYKSSKLIKHIYTFNSQNKFNLDDIINYINNTTLPIVVKYGAFNKDYYIKDKDDVIKSLNYYGSACDVEERSNCIFITFYIESDLL